jgi:hypothetical protein
MDETNDAPPVPANVSRSETLSDGTLLVWDPSMREAAWIHGDPTPVRR